MSRALVVSVGMTHPKNRAGLGVDVRVAADYGVRHHLVAAAVSAQDEQGVHNIFALPSELLLAQLQVVDLDDAAIVRIGAVGSARHLELLRGHLAGRRVVIDPVMRASAGGSLYSDDPLRALTSFGAGTGSVITPNLDEAGALTGREIATVDEMIAAGKALLRRGIDAALVKGGHLRDDPVDVLVTENGVETYSDTRLAREMRGTGCALAMALSCEIALGKDLHAAVQGARAYVRANIARS